MVVGALATDKPSRIAEFKRRKVRYDSKTVPTGQLANFLAKDWSRVGDLKTGVKVTPQRSGG